jgi:hypothetical protein
MSSMLHCSGLIVFCSISDCAQELYVTHGYISIDGYASLNELNKSTASRVTLVFYNEDQSETVPDCHATAIRVTLVPRTLLIPMTI